MRPISIRLAAGVTLLLTLTGSNSFSLHARSPISQSSVLAAQVIGQTQTQPLTLYQPIQTIQWEGQFLDRQGIAYFAEESVNVTTALESDLEQIRALRDRRKEAQLLARLGLLAYFEGAFDRAIAYYKASLELAKETGDRTLEGIALGNLGLLQVQNGFYTADVLDYLHDYWLFTRQQSQYAKADRRQEAIALGNLGNAYFGAELYAQAIDLHQQRLTLSRQIKDRLGEAKALGDLSLVYQAIGETSKALEYQQQQLAIARQISDLRGQSMALGHLGITAHTLGQYTQAANYQQQRLALAQQLNDPKATAEALANLAGTAYFLGDYKTAIAQYEQAWNLAWKQVRNAEVLYGIRGNEALVYFQLGDYEKARQFYQQYLTLVASRKNRRAQGAVKNNAAILRLTTGNVTAAETGLREAIADWESLRTRLGNSDAYKVSIFETQSAPYQNLQSLLVAQNKPEAALEISERGRARAFVELLVQRLPLASKSGAAAAPVVEPLAIAQIKQVAQAEKVTLVEYSILSENFKTQGKLERHESRLLIWVVKPTGEVVLREADLKPLWQKQQTTLAELVATQREAIGVRARGLGVVSNASTRQTSSQRLSQLYQLLIAPIADLLPTVPTARIVFVPQGSLFLVPFPALQAPNGQYLIEQHTIEIAPSIQVLDLISRQQATSRKQLNVGVRESASLKNRLKSSTFAATPSTSRTVIVGNPTMPQVAIAAGQPPEQLLALPGAEQEARAIATLLKTSALIGIQATETAVVQQMKTATLVHLATHGLLDDFLGLGVPGAIALAPSGKQDGLLTANEILDLKLSTDLVVLSACNTGQGRITGDGVVGLSRSLLSVGTRSIIVSLWAVPDEPTAFLMTEFYRTLYEQQLDKAQALRQAMLKTKQTYGDAPLNWAAFTLIGRAD